METGSHVLAPEVFCFLANIKGPGRGDGRAVTWGRIGGLTAWARNDVETMVGPAHRGFRRRFENQVDPEGRLDPVERGRRAERAMRAHMLTLAAKSAPSTRTTGRVSLAMSKDLMNCVYRHSHAKGAARSVLMALAWRADDRRGGSVTVSVAALAQWANCDRTTVQRARKALESLGELDVIEGGVGRGDMSTYWPGCSICHQSAVQKGGKSAALHEAQRAALRAGKGRICGGKGRHGRSPVSEGSEVSAAVGVEGANAAPTHEGAVVLRKSDPRSLSERIAATGTVGDSTFMAHALQGRRREG